MSTEVLGFSIGQQVTCTTKAWARLALFGESRQDESFPIYGLTYTIETILVLPGHPQVYLSLAELRNPLRYEVKDSTGQLYLLPVIFDCQHFRPSIANQLDNLLSNAGIRRPV